MRRIAIALVLSLVTHPVLADPVALPAAPQAGLLCLQAIASAARAHAVPPSLMAAVGQVESGRRDPTSGAVRPWPWTVDVEGQGAFYDTAAQAITAVRTSQRRGERSIDVGCMQVNLMHHPTAFASLEQAFDPAVNADFAARFLAQLYAQTGSWPQAAALYHSNTPQEGAAYRQKVMQAWVAEARLESPMPVVLARSAGAGVGSALFPPLRPHTGPRIIPRTMPGGGPVPPGRGLADYRASPIPTRRHRIGG